MKIKAYQGEFEANVHLSWPTQLCACFLLFIIFVWMTRVLLNCRCCKLLHSLLLNILIYNSLSWVNSLTCMRAPGHIGRCVCKQLHGCSLRTWASEVPGNPICTIAREVGSLQPKHRAWEGLQPCLKYQSQVVIWREPAGLVVNWGGQYLQ